MPNGSDTEAHDIDIRQTEHPLHLPALEEPREMEAVGDPQLGHAPHHMVHQIARAGHDETHVRNPLQHLGRSLDEIIGTFLVGDASQEA